MPFVLIRAYRQAETASNSYGGTAVVPWHQVGANPKRPSKYMVVNRPVLGSWPTHFKLSPALHAQPVQYEMPVMRACWSASEIEASFTHGSRPQSGVIAGFAKPLPVQPMPSQLMELNPMALNPMALNPIALNPIALNPIALNPIAFCGRVFVSGCDSVLALQPERMDVIPIAATRCMRDDMQDLLEKRQSANSILNEHGHVRPGGVGNIVQLAPRTQRITLRCCGHLTCSLQRI